MKDPKPFKLKPQVVPEKAIQTQILRYLQIRRVFSWQNDSVGIWDEKKGIYRRANTAFKIRGVSDILGIIHNRFLAIEVKTLTGRVSQFQKDFMLNVLNAGGIAFVARCVQDIDPVLFSSETYEELKEKCLTNLMSQKVSK